MGAGGALDRRRGLATPSDKGPAGAIFFGFAAAMLGISGFESSANFVEEQAEGVFPKTLRNMWAAVSFFNPMMALLALSLIPMAAVADHEEALLSHLGKVAGGEWLGGGVDIELEVVHGVFGPEIIDKLSRQWNVPKNFMFIGSPGDHFLYGLAELGGVRLII